MSTRTFSQAFHIDHRTISSEYTMTDPNRLKKKWGECKVDRRRLTGKGNLHLSYTSLLEPTSENSKIEEWPPTEARTCDTRRGKRPRRIGIIGKPRPAKIGKMQTVFIECKNGSDLSREMLFRVLLTSLILSAGGPSAVLKTEFNLWSLLWRACRPFDQSTSTCWRRTPLLRREGLHSVSFRSACAAQRLEVARKCRKRPTSSSPNSA
jgi:hypothetical protein